MYMFEETLLVPVKTDLLTRDRQAEEPKEEEELEEAGKQPRRAEKTASQPAGLELFSKPAREPPGSAKMLQFDQTLHHPYSTLHHPHYHSHHLQQYQHQLQQQQQQHSQYQQQQQHQQPQPPQQPATPHQIHQIHQQQHHHQQHQQHQQQHQHHQHQHQQHQQQQQQYNMNSDYSSSTYHIYDQISDLIIIKQQRMERKRQKEQRRKVILISLALVLLVSALSFLAIQALLGPQSAGNQLADGQLADPNQLSRVESRLAPPWAPPGAGPRSDSPGEQRAQTASQLVPGAGAGSSQASSSRSKGAICSGHGTVVIQNEVVLCKCDVGFLGDRCQIVAAFQADAANLPQAPVGAPGFASVHLVSQQQQPNPNQNPNQNQLNLQQLAKCMISNCSGRGHCNSLGRCQCHAGFVGAQCEFRLQPPAPAAVAGSLPAAPLSASGGGGAAAGCQCSNNGYCTPAGCRCYPGFAGPTCLERDLCHKHGCQNEATCLAATGECQCRFGYKGARCELRDEELFQRLFACSGRGKFEASLDKCLCDPGFAGFDCAEERCEPPAAGNGSAPAAPPPDCGPNGLFDCRQNRCLCQDGYSGDLCQVRQCSAQCLRNGHCLNGACVCKPGYYGKHCSLNGCPNQCSQRGQCLRVASASSAFAANDANQVQVQLPAQVAGHPASQQAAEWRCQCEQGTTGDDCSVLLERHCDDGLDNDNDGLVDCADSECCSDRACYNSTLCMKSPDPLDILMRKQPPPPTSSFFQRMQFLIEKFSSQIYSNSKDFSPSITTSRYSDRASVVRGRVVYQKQGVTGVSVSVAGQTNLGITFSRDGGYFDLLVNGGGAVTIEFRREPFATKQKTVRAPWNEIVLIDQVELKLADSSGELEHQAAPNLLPEASESPSCSAHNYRLMRPHMVAAPKSSRRSQWQARSALGKLESASQLGSAPASHAVVLRESGMVQQSVRIPGSGFARAADGPAEAAQSVSLVYISSRANEFMSTIHLQLTPPADQQRQLRLPQELKAIHLKIVIEGNLFEQLFEPQMNLSFVYAWNRRNVYRQKCFGVSTASVSVGYEYFDCRHVIWSTKHVQLPGHDLSISDIGNQWSLNIHHRYNYRDSILQRGDGQNFHLKTDKPLVVQPVLGNGYPRQTLCSQCEPGNEQRLLKPQALVSAPDGALYVADSNLIKRLEWPAAGTGNADQQQQQQQQQPLVKTVLELPSSRVPSKYSLALNLADQRLYMGDIDRHQIYQIREQQTENETVGQPLYPSEESLVPVAGNGLRCELEDRANCGDGHLARQARLISPKAVAFDLAGRMYIADGPNVRMVDTDSRIYTILGDYGATRHTKFPCSGEAVPMHKFLPKEPLDLAVNPIDDSLHVLDDNVVYKITQDKRIQVVAGRLAHCPAAAEASGGQRAARHAASQAASDLLLQSARSMVFNQDGELFIVEEDLLQQVSRVLLVSPEEDTVRLYAGQPALDSSTAAAAAAGEPLDKQRFSNALPAGSHWAPSRAVDYKFNSIAAIAVDQQGRLLVADRLQLRVLSVEPDLQQVNALGEHEIQSPDNPDELLVFNRYGHHVATRDISQGQRSPASNKYTFSYNVNTSFGVLAAVTYATGNKISIYREGPHHSAKMIETAYGGQVKLDISRHGQLQAISTSPDLTKTNLSYHNEGGLLRQSRDQSSGELFDFSYDEFGRATRIRHSSPRASAPLDCRVPAASVGQQQLQALKAAGSSYANHHCSNLIVSE